MRDAARPGRHRPRHPAARHAGAARPRDVPLGEITSGTFSPTLRKGVALALLDRQVEDGAEVLGRRPRPPRGVRGHQAAVRADPTSRSPDDRTRLVLRTSSHVPWWWQRSRPTDGSTVEPADGRQEFPTRGDAESWVGEFWADLAEDGVAAVTLFEGDRQVYGPMRLDTQ